MCAAPNAVPSASVNDACNAQKYRCAADGSVTTSRVADTERHGRDEGKQWLAKFGDPYALSAFDVDGKVGIDYGVYGVPETFVIDRQGVIRYKQIGPITPEALERKILPLLKKLAA